LRSAYVVGRANLINSLFLAKLKVVSDGIF